MPLHQTVTRTSMCRHHARPVADSHLTDFPVESNHSGVVSLGGFNLFVFLSELNSMELWGTNISSACLEVHTKEKVCIPAGPEFGPLKGHQLLVDEALCGLQTSGQRWQDRFAKCMRAEGFEPCKAEPDIWMCSNGNVCECAAVCVDNLAFVVADPKAFAKASEKKHHFKLKGTGPLSFHFGADFTRDADGVLCMKPTK